MSSEEGKTSAPPPRIVELMAFGYEREDIISKVQQAFPGTSVEVIDEEMARIRSRWSVEATPKQRAALRQRQLARLELWIRKTWDASNFSAGVQFERVLSAVAGIGEPVELDPSESARAAFFQEALEACTDEEIAMLCGIEERMARARALAPRATESLQGSAAPPRELDDDEGDDHA